MANKTGLAKAVTVLVTVLLVSAGLCGVNFVAVMGVSGVSSLSPRTQQTVSNALIGLGVVELAGNVLSLLGLIVVGVIAIVRAVSNRAASDVDAKGE